VTSEARLHFEPQSGSAADLPSAHEPASAAIVFTPGAEDGALVPPPSSSRAGICHWCRGLMKPGDEMCFNCDENARALDGTVQPVIPISIYAKPSAARDWLTFYKSDGDLPAEPAAQEAIGAILARFFDENQAWVRELRADGVIVVPSTLRPAPHPLEVLLRHRSPLPLGLLPGLNRTAAPLGHNRPNPDAFSTSPNLEGKRVLLLDDVYTSGARAQSAAFALRRAGAEVTALCVIGRRYNPSYSEQSSEVFSAQSSVPFTWAIDHPPGSTQTSGA